MPPEVATAPAAQRSWSRTKSRVFTRAFAPQPHLTPSEWAEERRIVSQGPHRGQRWTNEMTPYLVEILDFMGAPWARMGVVRKSARIGYTEGVGGNVVGWTVDMDPCPMAIVQPSDGEAESYSKEQVGPMIELNPELSSRIGATGSRSSESTITYKEFPGGFLSILGSASDRNMRRRSFRRIIVDEVDGMKVDSKEGDPILRLRKRTDDYEDGVLLMGSTPVTKHRSRIDREFARSDQRFFFVPCPHCEGLQRLQWGGPDVEYGIKWDRQVHCSGCGVEIEGAPDECPDCGGESFTTSHDPETAHYVCEHCGEQIDESEKANMVRAGQWIATRPRNPTPGWHLDALVSLFPGARWGKLAQEWLEAQGDDADLQVFFNTVLGQAWEEQDQKADLGELEARAEEYLTGDGEVVDVPDGVGVLTAAVDVQKMHLELLVEGWGVGEERWDILHERIHGDPESSNTWARLEGLLTRPYRHVNGGELRIMCTLVDAGYLRDTVFGFTKLREGRNVFACIGDRTGTAQHPPLKGPSRSNADKVPVFTIGTYQQKDALFRRLAIQKPGPRYIHLRKHNADRCNGFDANYFNQFDAEKKVTRKGKSLYINVDNLDNEAIDLHVYNQGALQVLGAGVRMNMEAWVEAARRKPGEEPKAEPSPKKKRGGSGGSWATGWK